MTGENVVDVVLVTSAVLGWLFWLRDVDEVRRAKASYRKATESAVIARDKNDTEQADQAENNNGEGGDVLVLRLSEPEARIFQRALASGGIDCYPIDNFLRSRTGGAK